MPVSTSQARRLTPVGAVQLATAKSAPSLSRTHLWARKHSQKYALLHQRPSRWRVQPNGAHCSWPTCGRPLRRLSTSLRRWISQSASEFGSGGRENERAEVGSATKPRLGARECCLRRVPKCNSLCSSICS